MEHCKIRGNHAVYTKIDVYANPDIFRNEENISRMSESNNFLWNHHDSPFDDDQRFNVDGQGNVYWICNYGAKEMLMKNNMTLTDKYYQVEPFERPFDWMQRENSEPPWGIHFLSPDEKHWAVWAKKRERSDSVDIVTDGGTISCPDEYIPKSVLFNEKGTKLAVSFNRKSNGTGYPDTLMINGEFVLQDREIINIFRGYFHEDALYLEIWKGEESKQSWIVIEDKAVEEISSLDFFHNYPYRHHMLKIRGSLSKLRNSMLIPHINAGSFWTLKDYYAFQLEHQEFMENVLSFRFSGDRRFDYYPADGSFWNDERIFRIRQVNDRIMLASHPMEADVETCELNEDILWLESCFKGGINEENQKKTHFN